LSPVTHLFMGWTVSNLGPFTPRQRAAITLASVVPDVDGVGIVVDWATSGATSYYSDFHHVVGHNLFAAFAVAVGCALVGPTQRLASGAMGLLSFHLHLLADLAGSRGPDGSQWDIVYLWPASSQLQLKVPWQWELNAWPNALVTAALLALTLYLAWKRGFSILELVAPAADSAVVQTLRRRFG
jgi:inner membrane protein